MKPTVTYKDRDGKRRKKVVRASIFADPNEVVREFCKTNYMPTNTYIYNVTIGLTTYVWHGKAHEAFTSEELKNYPYLN